MSITNDALSALCSERGQCCSQTLELSEAVLACCKRVQAKYSANKWKFCLLDSARKKLALVNVSDAHPSWLESVAVCRQFDHA